jgi:peptide/nickel transport system permease protein
MLNYIVTKMFTAALVVLGVICLVFLLIHMVPGDPVDIMLGESARPADREAMRVALGLDKPVLVQLQNYLTGLMQFDLGSSMHSRRPVTDILLERLPATVQLAVAALSVSILVAFPLGIIAAIRKDTPWDRGAMTFSLIGVSVPNFWMGPVLILVFSLWLGWFPVSGKNGIASIVLPAVTLGTALAAILSRMVRSTLLEVLNEDYMRTARAKGLKESTVILKHGMRNALLPVITLLGLQLGVLLGGAVITETVFSWPGIGKLTIDSILKRDYPVVQACVLLISVSYVFVNVITDLVYAWVDPRIRQGRT